MSKIRVVVIGNGMVGHHYVQTLLDSALALDITIIGGEPRPAYDRVNLSKVFENKSPQDLAFASIDDYQSRGIKTHFGEFVSTIDRQAKSISTDKGNTFYYDKLVLATGSFPFVPPIPGHDNAKCLTYRTIEDLDAIKTAAEGCRTGVVIGGGLLGLECANALKNLGLEAHVVEFAPGLMGVQLDSGGSQMLRHKIEGLGVHVHTNKTTENITNDKAQRLSMAFADGTELTTDLIVFSAGIRPHDQLARDCGLTVGDRGGIVIDERCLTSDENIFAVGECASYNNFIYGLVAPGYRMAEVAASQLLPDVCEKLVFEGADMSTKLKLLGVDVGSIGDAKGEQGPEQDSRSLVFKDQRNQVYKRLNISADGKKVLGATLVGDTSDYDTLLQYFVNQIDLPQNPENLILPMPEGHTLALSPRVLPATAIICNCHNVSKSQIVDAINSGCASLEDIQLETKASSGCGSCSSIVQELLEITLIQGEQVENTATQHNQPPLKVAS